MPKSDIFSELEHGMYSWNKYEKGKITLKTHTVSNIYQQEIELQNQKKIKPEIRLNLHYGKNDSF